VSYWSTEVRSDRGVFAELAEWWDEQPTARRIPFLRTSVIECWVEGFLEPGEGLHVMLLRRNGDVVAAMPMRRSGFRLRSLSNGLTSRYDLVAVLDDEVAERIPRWLNSVPVAHLYRIREDSVIVGAMSEQSRWLVRYERDSPYVDLSGGMEGVRSDWSRNFRRNMRRRRRRLEELGTVTYVDHPGAADVQQDLEAGLELEANGWKGEEGIAVLRDPAYERWYRALTEVALDEEWLRLSSLYLDDRLLAFGYDLVYEGRRYGMLTTYDESPDVAPLSVANLMLESTLQHSCDEGLESYEMGPDFLSYKFDWTSLSNKVYDVSIYGSRPTGRLLHLLQRGRSH
jgi:CelD/BcsL family acetyltransferase involved in cellulose biosynthesis